jgi:hypothetical protein
VKTNSIGELSWHVPREMLPEWIPERQDVEFPGYSREEKNERIQKYLMRQEAAPDDMMRGLNKVLDVLGGDDRDG